MPHWVYILAAVGGPAGLATWRCATRAFLMLVGGLTKDAQRSKQCAEMIRLSRGDAKDLPSYLMDSPQDGAPPVSKLRAGIRVNSPPVGVDLAPEALAASSLAASDCALGMVSSRSF